MTDVELTSPRRIAWPVPEPELPEATHSALADACRAAATALRAGRHRFDRDELGEQVRMGADGTPTSRVDDLVENAIAEAAARHGVNLLSEEAGFLDHGSALTLVVDPVDGTGNSAAGVPLSCFAGVLALDGKPIEALTCWFDTGRCWYARADEPTEYRTTGRTALDGAQLCLQRPKQNQDTWSRLAARASRVRVLGTTALECALVAEGSADAYADPGSDTHRIMDLAAAMVTVPAAGGVVIDAMGRPLELDVDLTRRWSGIAAATPALAEEIAAVVFSAPAG
ncbi:inositol monophosphatase [Crossiella sp. CA-258035]|uniref:inositol monophosphatase family protein n=1 Tax=Crossiella sp. CA-258035 TaxID=2981138 RepID=UPI0024BC8597|nr:inositol monophosphatase family protein [Crossiella sp. CA-258035]WHT18776.1 inositol monophosphatase [Crossiella sp. CA-258035]